MRQAGIIAAAGIVSLEKMVGRLTDDHIRAKKLAAGLSGLPGIKLNPEVPPTNMVYFDLLDSNPLTINQVEQGLKDRGILGGSMSPTRFRMVTHCEVNDADIELTISAMKEILR